MLVILNNIKNVVCVVSVVGVVALGFFVNVLNSRIEAKESRIRFLEESVVERDRSFKNLQDSCFLTQKMSEDAAKMKQEFQSSTESLKGELDKLLNDRETAFNSEKAHQETAKTSVVIGEPQDTENNGSEGLKHQGNMGKQNEQSNHIANINDSLNPSLVRLLDKAYCTSTRDSVYCGAKGYD